MTQVQNKDAMRPRRLLPLLLLALFSVVVVEELQSLSLTFSVPAPQQSHHGLHRSAQLKQVLPPLAGLPVQTPAWPGLAGFRQSKGLDSENLEAPLSLVLAATALAAAAAASEGSAEGDASKEVAKVAKEAPTALGKLWQTVKLPVFVGLWYFFNVQYNIQNKMLLKVFSATWAVSWFQLCAGIPIALLMWGTGLVRKPSVTGSDLTKLAPVGAAFALGQVATVASLGAVAVSFTHVVKALEPAVNAIASAFILGQVFHPMVYLSLLPVFAGVALASSSELSFTMFGFACAMLSNFAFVARNVFATKLGSVGDMGEDKTTRKTNQLAVLTFVATAVLFPIALFLPGGLLAAPAAWKVALTKVSLGKLLYMSIMSGVTFFMYQMSSFWVLSCVQPITHSVLNTLKRIVIIVVSIVVFQNPVTRQGAIGTATAIGGVLLYSLTKAYYSKKDKK